MPANDLTMRPITGRAELDLFRRLPYDFNDALADDLAAGRRRPEWTWVALRGDRLPARVAWWGRSADDTPQLLDIVDVEDGSADRDDPVHIGVRPLRTAMAATLPDGPRPADGGPVEYSRFVPPHWREDPATRQAAEDRMAVLERTGARFFVERLRLEWRPESEALPAPGERLGFRPVHDDEELVALMASALEGTLDAHSRADLARMSVHEAAVEHYEDELARYPSPRDRWRVATRWRTPSGAPVTAPSGVGSS
ncbi:GNAT family N-acetyltransferase [Streptomyces chrestomyceticus]|uniref:GNAT family N-acetyltransferase n=1 Tax=Streptomyces chrestomyceticus TaxID=68185 RepID=A0ABU7WWH7_9ACTN